VDALRGKIGAQVRHRLEILSRRIREHEGRQANQRAQAAQDAIVSGCDTLVEDLNQAGSGIGQAQDHANRRGFACSIGSKKPKDFSTFYTKRDLFY